MVVETSSEYYALIDKLRASDVPVYEFSEDGARALAAMSRYAEMRDRKVEEPPKISVDRAAAEAVVKRFEGRESEPDEMLSQIYMVIDKFQVVLAGVDYGGGFWPNDKLIGKYGWRRIAKYQYSTVSAKVRWEDGLKRFLVNRTEVMSDIFNAIKRRDIRSLI